MFTMTIYKCIYKQCFIKNANLKVHLAYLMLESFSELNNIVHEWNNVTEDKVNVLNEMS